MPVSVHNPVVYESWNPFNASSGSPTQSISKRQYRLAHQALCITHIDFEQRLVIGFTQLVIWPTTSTLRRIHINCRQCRIHRILLEIADNEPAGFENGRKGRNSGWVIPKAKLLPSPTDLPILYTDPTLEICERDIKLRTLDSFERRYASVVASTDPDEDAGEVTVRLPSDFWPLVSQKFPFIITIEFSLNKPKSGFYFVVPEGEGSLSERGVHAFTACTPNCSRLWFPCIDCSEPCTWKIEVTVFEDLVAVAPGELIDAPYYTEDLTHKTYHFFVSQPVAAPYIGLAVGAFEIFPDPRLSNGATHFCPSELLPLLQHTISPLSEIIEYYESILASQYPFSTIKCVFVDCAFSKFQSFASLIILSVDLLHSPRVIDQAIETRKVLSLAVAHQFFGCFLIMETWCDAWLTFGLAGYLSGLYQKRVFGNNEYRKMVFDEMHFVSKFENMRYGVVLDPSKLTSKPTYFDLSSSHLISPDYLSAYKKKSHLVIRMLELRLGHPVLLQVLNKLLVLARLSTKSILSVSVENQIPSVGLDGCERNKDDSIPTGSNSQPQHNLTVPPCLSDEHRTNILLSTASFRRVISMVTGQDIRNFLNQWACHAGHVRLFAKFHFNRKRNVVELELKQDLQSRGTLNYTGPITVMLQELDGAFMHTFKLEEGRMSRDLPCHSKSRKHRKKKISLANGDEVDMDLARIDPESPLLWLRIDPDLAIIHDIRVDQPDFMWHLMLAHDRDCLGQLEAVNSLRDFSSPETRHVLSNVILNEKIFYHVRMEACFTLCHVVNELSALSNNPAATSAAVTSCLLPMFWQLFSSPAARGLIRQNNFTNLQHYFLQRAMIKALSTLRVQQVCPHEVLIFLSDLLKHNDNSRNPYSDGYYLADLVKAMKDTLTPAIIVRGVMSASTLPFEARTVIEEVSHLLNLETETISYKGTVTVVCLAAIRRLQRLGFLPIDPSLFYQYALSKYYCDIRLAAIEAIVDYIRGERDQSALDWLFSNIIEREDVSDASYVRLRFETVQLLLRIPPFQRGETGSRLDTPQLVERLWTLINYGCTGDPRLRCAVAELYYTLYGNRRPTCLPLPDGVLLVRVKEGRSLLNLSDSNSRASELDYIDELSKYKSECLGRGMPLSKMHEEYEELEVGYSECEKLHPNNLKFERDSIIRPTGSELTPQFELKRSRTGNFSDINDSSNVFKRRTERLSDDDDDR
ncbi:Transcription initiation factor TFIID subunit 2 [Schistosoma japonicum]|uniref:Transcription initiation factor TFIID subunit 2 n=1 Tax=Schistosoma japonicum TaxID=6182 RepID=A0A4Z2D6C2_SCHJA|nr:Transcription initiation factor TFIID subunit 2 [Schistosoma japonicum]